MGNSACIPFGERQKRLARTDALPRRRALIIGVVTLIGVLLYAASVARVGGGFPLDDAWIHQTYARNLAQTGQWAFTPGIPSAGSTAPLYTVILAVGYVLGVDYRLWAYVVGGIALFGAGLFSAMLAVRLFPAVRWVGVGAGVAVVTCAQLLGTSVTGMETPLSAACVALILFLTIDQQQSGRTPAQTARSGAGFGLACAAFIALRPEGALLGGLAGLAVLISRPHPTGRHLAAWIAGAALGGLIGISPYLALNFALNGSPLPTTAAAKQAEYAELLARGPIVNFYEVTHPAIVGGTLIFLIGVPVAVANLWRAGSGRAIRLLPLIWAFSLALLYTLRLPVGYHQGRYFLPAVPGLIVVGVGGVLILITNRALVRRSFFVRVLRVAVVVFQFTFMVYGALAMGQNVQAINSEMVTAAQWVQAHIPPDQLLAVHDIGAIGYFANSPAAPRPILDLAGLVSPEVIPFFRDPVGMAALMESRSVRWLMVLPDQWAALWRGQEIPYARRFCLRFDANGLMGGMRIYEFYNVGPCPP